MNHDVMPSWIQRLRDVLLAAETRDGATRDASVAVLRALGAHHAALVAALANNTQSVTESPLFALLRAVRDDDARLALSLATIPPAEARSRYTADWFYTANETGRSWFATLGRTERRFDVIELAVHILLVETIVRCARESSEVERRPLDWQVVLLYLRPALWVENMHRRYVGISEIFSAATPNSFKVAATNLKAGLALRSSRRAYYAPQLASLASEVSGTGPRIYVEIHPIKLLASTLCTFRNVLEQRSRQEILDWPAEIREQGGAFLRQASTLGADEELVRELESALKNRRTSSGTDDLLVLIEKVARSGVQAFTESSESSVQKVGDVRSRLAKVRAELGW